MIYLTTGTATLPEANGILIQVNAALTGTLTVNDGGVARAVITNPAVGDQFRYYGFTGVPTVVASTTCNATISILNTTR